MINEILSSNYLKMYIGPMFSSKSSSLLSEINRYKYITDKILVINHVLDKQRHTSMNKDGGILKTHDDKIFPAIMLNELNELKTNTFYFTKYEHAQIVIIDEGQFYNDLYSFLKTELNNTHQRKLFIVAGLSSDFNMEPIGDITKIIPLADEVIKLNAYCVYCKNGTLANFTKREYNLKNSDQILVGSNDLYSPCCRYHFLM